MTTPISLVGTASYLPETVRDNAFFGESGSQSPMFKGSRFRHHVAPGETATDRDLPRESSAKSST